MYDNVKNDFLLECKIITIIISVGYAQYVVIV